MASSVAASTSGRCLASLQACAATPGRTESNTFASCSPRPFLRTPLSGSSDSAFAGTRVAAFDRSCSSRVTMMGNKNDGKGIFAPLVKVTRNVVGVKEFNQLRGKGIALHSQVITEFCKSIGADAKQRQGLIRLAKKNGEKLGFLA